MDLNLIRYSFRCAVCQMCGTSDPGFNSQWYDNYSLCGPCHSLSLCTACEDGYEDGELIVQCTTCQRWSHGECDSINNEEEAEKCAVAGYSCQLCRPHDEPPPHIVQQALEASKKLANPSPPPSPGNNLEKDQLHRMKSNPYF
jgi:hypothetical protein